MGVPKFFRYISERYPNLSELVGSAELPRFDNMYLDMNGIIHVCSHPDDSNVHFRMSEELMFQNILHYIDTLFRMIQPQKLFFMAVDGVAPRAKMNQQRGRRFQSARTAIELIEKAKKNGEKLPEESRFDSNCITPGTAFMVRLQEVFKHFVKMKLSTDPLWKHCRIILSGHETPGEGEHKVMEYIRYLKSQPDYDPNTRHCLYGLDADLIMLGLCSHELNFALLREEVKFDKKAKRPLSVDETQFYLLHLGLLREYLELEFVELKPQLKFDYDIEKIIDDWIFMCFMVGNDFIPHLPNLHINSNALPLLYKVYKKVLPQLDGYMNEGGQLNLARFEKFMEEMAEIDRDLFREHYEDLKLFETKYDNDETFGTNITELPPSKMDPALADLVKRTMLEFSSDDESTSDSSDDDDDESESSLLFDGQKAKDVFAGVDEDDDLDNDQLFEKEFAMHKRNYYITKMKYPEVTEEVLAEQTRIYITALQWILNYYYRGVCSWSWYYPHHYAPYMSDIKNFKNLKLDYNLGHPFLPFEQLLSVLPTASKELLPTAYHKLMTDASSKIIDYYPVDFETDLNGKKQEWEALVLIPFIDEKRLMDAMNDCNDRLTENEKNRNKHGPMLQYDYCDEDQGSEPEKCGLPMIGHVFCKETGISRDEVIVPTQKLVLGPCPGASKDAYFPGFPTMRHLKHTAKLDMKRIKVFQQPSRNESMIISIDEKPFEDDIKVLAKQFVGQEVYIGWPHLRLAKVFAVSDSRTRIEKSGIEEFKEGNREFILQAKHVAAHHLLRLGIDLGDINQLLHVYPLVNREYMNTNDGKLTLSKNWSKIPLAVAPISVVRNIKIYEKELQKFKKIEDVFTKDSIVFLMTKDYYGCQGTITDSNIRNGRIKIQTMKYPQPDFTRARQIHKAESQSYMNSYTASTKIGLNPRLFNRITSCVLIVSGEKRFPISDSDKKTNVGLNLKHLKQNEEIPGYTKSANNQWLYSQNAIDVVHAYHEKFPKLFELMNNENKDGKDFIFESELNEGRSPGEESMLKEIQRWLREQSCTSINRQPCGTECLSPNCISAVVMDVNEMKSKPVNVVRLQIKPHLLYKPNLNEISVLPERDVTFQLFDRVVIARDNYIVPLGMRGTVISILPISDPNPVRQENINVVDHLFEVLFDAPFERGTTVPGVEGNRVLKVRKSVLINVSHGIGRPREETSYERNWRLENGNGRMNMKDKKSQELRETFGSVNESSPPVENYWLSRNQKPKLEQKQPPHQPRPNGAPSKKFGGAIDLEKKMSDLNWRNKAEPQQQVASNQNNSADDSGDALRKLLRIGNEAPLQNNVFQPNVSQPISLNTLFGKVPNGDEKIMPSLASLPKPPANWHQKPKAEPTVEPEQPSQHPNQSNMVPLPNRPMFPQLLHNFPPLGMPGNMPGSMPFAFQPPQHMMMAPNMVSQPNFPWHQLSGGMSGPLPFTNQGHHVRMPVVQSFHQQHIQQMHGQPSNYYQQSMHQPEGPGNLKKDMNRNASYNSAFIPLQAARKITKNKSGVHNYAPINRENIDNKNGAEATKKPNPKAPNKSNKDNQPQENKNKPQAQKSKQAQDMKPNAVKIATKPQNNEDVQIENKTKVELKKVAIEKDKPMSNNNKTPSKRLACNFSIKPVDKKSQPN